MYIHAQAGVGAFIELTGKNLLLVGGKLPRVTIGGVVVTKIGGDSESLELQVPPGAKGQ